MLLHATNFTPRIVASRHVLTRNRAIPIRRRRQPRWRRGAVALTAVCVLGLALAADAQAQGRRVYTAISAGPEVNSLGDIPDSQVFVTYRSNQGYSIKVPEGWARSEQSGFVRFSDKYNAVQIDLSARAAAPALVDVRADLAATLKRQPNAFEIIDVRSTTLPAGNAVVARLRAESQPNAVTGKAIRLDSENIHFWRAGQHAVITLSAPVGADNVDQWRLMTNSFAWTPAKP